MGYDRCRHPILRRFSKFVVCYVVTSSIGGIFLTEYFTTKVRTYSQPKLARCAGIEGAIDGFCTISTLPRLGDVAFSKALHTRFRASP